MSTCRCSCHGRWRKNGRPYLWLDVTYVKVHKNGRVVSVAVIIVCAVNSDGRWEIIRMGIGESEAKALWLAFLLSLKERGLEGVKLVISDAHSGLKAAIQQVFSASWQRCRVYFNAGVPEQRGEAVTNAELPGDQPLPAADRAVAQ